MLEEDGKEFNKRWGYLSRAGLNDKSQFTRQIEKYAGDFPPPLSALGMLSRFFQPQGCSMYRSCCARLSEERSHALSADPAGMVLLTVAR